MSHILSLLIAVCALLTVATATASAVDSKTSPKVNVDQSGLALQGFDPVAFFTQSQAVLGKADQTATHAGATYRFADAKNKALFVAEPTKYVPQYGGFCAFGASKGQCFPIDISTWQVMNGKLYFNKSGEVRQKMDAETTKVIKEADMWWTDYIKG